MKNRNEVKVTKGILTISCMLSLAVIIMFTLIEDNEIRKIFLSLILLIVIVIIISRVLKYLIIKKMDIAYIREIPNKYSIPIIAYLFNRNINLYSIIKAMILKLQKLNLIIEKKENGKVSYIGQRNSNSDNLSISELYLYEWIINSDKTNYSFKQFIEILSKELKESDLISQEEKFIKPKVILVAIGLMIIPILNMLGYLSYEVYNTFIMILGAFAILFALISKFQPESLPEYSKKGFMEHYKVLGFCRFLEDFTNLSKRNMEEHIIWKDYLEFAVLFNINNNYKLNDEFNLLTEEEVSSILEDIGDN